MPAVLDVSMVAWIATVGGIAALFAVDLFVSGRHAHVVEFREAVFWSVLYIGIAVLFGVGFGIVAGWDYGAEYFAGYVVEKSLSVDNLFVFVIIMTTFAVPPEHQQRVLTFGIMAALILRAIFIAIGAALIATFSVAFLLFGVLLIFTAVQLFRHRDEDPSVTDNPMVVAARRWLPFTDEYHERKLVVRVDGRRLLTPLALVFVAIGSTDVLFALDSIPAVFGVTQEAYIVFVANAFALLGLRALYFLVSGLLDRLVYLSTGLAVILGFIGIKLVLHFAHEQSDAVPEVTTGQSLIFIAVVLTITTVASVIRVRRDPAARAHAGSLRGHPPAEGDPRG